MVKLLERIHLTPHQQKVVLNYVLGIGNSQRGVIGMILSLEEAVDRHGFAVVSDAVNNYLLTVEAKVKEAESGGPNMSCADLRHRGEYVHWEDSNVPCPLCSRIIVLDEMVKVERELKATVENHAQRLLNLESSLGITPKKSEPRNSPLKDLSDLKERLFGKRR